MWDLGAFRVFFKVYVHNLNLNFYLFLELELEQDIASFYTFNALKPVKIKALRYVSFLIRAFSVNAVLILQFLVR